MRNTYHLQVIVAQLKIKSTKIEELLFGRNEKAYTQITKVQIRRCYIVM